MVSTAPRDNTAEHRYAAVKSVAGGGGRGRGRGGTVRGIKLFSFAEYPVQTYSAQGRSNKRAPTCKNSKNKKNNKGPGTSERITIGIQQDEGEKQKNTKPPIFLRNCALAATSYHVFLAPLYIYVRGGPSGSVGCPTIFFWHLTEGEGRRGCFAR